MPATSRPGEYDTYSRRVITRVGSRAVVLVTVVLVVVGLVLGSVALFL